MSEKGNKYNIPHTHDTYTVRTYIHTYICFVCDNVYIKHVCTVCTIASLSMINNEMQKKLLELI